MSAGLNHPSGRILRHSRFRLFVRSAANVVVEYTRPRESMSRILTRVVGVAVLLVVPHLARAQGQLRAGAAKTAVTPDVHKNSVYLAGFGHNRVATGVHDELYVRCLALEAGRQIVTLCSVDVIGLFYDDVLKIREQVKAQAPEVSHLIVASTHVHEGPDTLGLWGPTPLQTGIDENYLDWLDSQIAATAVKATRSMQPARMELSRDDHPLLALLQSVDRPPLVKDPYLFLMHLTSIGAGKTIAVLVNWSDHPETLGGENSEITACHICLGRERATGRQPATTLVVRTPQEYDLQQAQTQAPTCVLFALQSKRYREIVHTKGTSTGSTRYRIADRVMRLEST